MDKSFLCSKKYPKENKSLIKNLCISCKQDSNIVIKDTEYCNQCFTSVQLKKYRKNLDTIEKDHKVLFCLSQSLISYVMLFFIFKCFRLKDKIFILVSTDCDKKILDLIEKFQLNIIKDNFIINSNYEEYRTNMINFASDNNFDILLLDENIHMLVTFVLTGFCTNQIQNLNERIQNTETYKNLYILKPFSNFIDKEILYCYFLFKEIVSFKIYNFKFEPLFLKCYDFVYHLSLRNYSTPFNVINTLKKAFLEIKEEELNIKL
ncbi:hypothetical protein CWI38_0104p0010 [Hamiltosporidium tvaerminnensis]|uniref:Cytoplasmic tRNA 2-thiolation protein 2 n=1 Tax=Hamiltosporidium tvaerminnensis TaxID=1176355 RepID=A0A4Q9M0T1_9MICR|nr:hypothetical protein CWI38_0104p0010 [Hamiltosporidium tvaerminnensis]